MRRMRISRLLSIGLALTFLAGLCGWWSIRQRLVAITKVERPASPEAEPRIRAGSPRDLPSDASVGAPVDSHPWQVSPAELDLVAPGDSCQVVVTQPMPDGSTVDRTRKCQFEVIPPTAATVTDGGRVEAQATGEFLIRVRHGDSVSEIHGIVRQAGHPS